MPSCSYCYDADDNGKDDNDYDNNISTVPRGKTCEQQYDLMFGFDKHNGFLHSLQYLNLTIYLFYILFSFILIFDIALNVICFVFQQQSRPCVDVSIGTSRLGPSTHNLQKEEKKKKGKK